MRIAAMMLTAFILFPCLCSCVSRNHMGVRQWSSSDITCRSVSNTTTNASSDYEIKVIKIISASNYEDIQKLFSDKFRRNISPVDVERIKHTIDTFKFNGEYKVRNIVSFPISLDEAIMWDGYNKFHYVLASYYLKGIIDASLEMYIHRRDGKFELVGLSLIPADEKLATKIGFRHLYLDNVDSNESIYCPCAKKLSFIQYKCYVTALA